MKVQTTRRFRQSVASRSDWRTRRPICGGELRGRPRTPQTCQRGERLTAQRALPALRPSARRPGPATDDEQYANAGRNASESAQRALTGEARARVVDAFARVVISKLQARGVLPATDASVGTEETTRCDGAA